MDQSSALLSLTDEDRAEFLHLQGLAGLAKIELRITATNDAPAVFKVLRYGEAVKCADLTAVRAQLEANGVNILTAEQLRQRGAALISGFKLAVDAAMEAEDDRAE